jgi:hypothetical protein
MEGYAEEVVIKFCLLNDGQSEESLDSANHNACQFRTISQLGNQAHLSSCSKVVFH